LGTIHLILIDDFLNDDEWDIFNSEVVWGEKISNNFVPVDELGMRGLFVEEIVLKIWNTFSLDHKDNMQYYEYWTNFLSPDEPLDWHIDKDEVMYEESQQLSKPAYGAVLYPDHKVSGGFLEIEHSKGEVERIAPMPNRLVLFHAGDKYHRVSPIHYGQRMTLATNLWGKL